MQLPANIKSGVVSAIHMWENKVRLDKNQSNNFSQWVAAMQRLYPKYIDDILEEIRKSPVLVGIIDRASLNVHHVAPRRGCCGR